MTRLTEINSPDTDDADQNWCHVAETVRMLQAATAQIRLSMTEGHDSVTTLTDSFTTLVGKATVIGEAARHLPDSQERDTILATYQRLHDKIQEAIIAFQFYDKLTQRLEHVAHSLNSLGELVGDADIRTNPYEWKGLQDTIKSRYTIESDKAMFAAILEGASVEDALQLCREKAAGEPDDIELF